MFVTIGHNSLSWKECNSGEITPILNSIVSVESQKGRYYHSMVFRWEPEGHYCCTKSMAIVPFWFSEDHCWTVSTPFCFSTNNVCRHMKKCVYKCTQMFEGIKHNLHVQMLFARLWMNSVTRCLLSSLKRFIRLVNRRVH